MSHRPAVHGYQSLEPVSAVRRGGQSQPDRRADLADHALEGNGRDVVAFVDDHEPISRGQFADVLPARQRLHHRDIDDAPQTASSATERADLAAFETEMLLQALAPLLG
jgi:hypothetical protein